MLKMVTKITALMMLLISTLTLTTNGVYARSIYDATQKEFNDRGINIKWYGAKGDNTYDNATILSNIISSTSSTDTDLYFPKGVYKVSSNITFPSNITLNFANGAAISVDSGKTITIDGAIKAELNCIFAGMGTIAGNPNIEKIYPQWWGAKGDNTDCNSAFSNALCAAVNMQKPLYVPNGVYNLNGLTVITQNKLSIRGQDVKNTILKNIGGITVNADIDIENVSIIDTVSSTTLTLDPTSFSNITIKNVIADNADSNFVDKSRANGFIYYSYAGIDKGIANIKVEDSKFSHFASEVIRLRGYVKCGSISNNEFTEIGYDTNKSVYVIIAGYQGDGNIITAPAKNLIIENNCFENIYSKNGLTDQSAEGHAILIYGDSIHISDNTVKNLYGGGRLPANLDSGYDHEAIYIKAPNSIIESNYIENGVGQLGNGAITTKASDNTQVLNNYIKGDYGTGIHVTSPNELVSGNTINISAGKGGISASSNERVFITNNHITLTGTDIHFGIYVGGLSCDNYVTGGEVVNNDISVESGIGIYLLSNCTVEGNNITSLGQYCIKGYNLSKIIIKNNKAVITSGDVNTSSYNIYIVADIDDFGENSVIVDNNYLYNSKPKNVTHPSCCASISGKNVIFSQNFVYSSTDVGMYIYGVGLGNKVSVSDNDFISLNSKVFFSSATNEIGEDLTIENNRFSYSTDGTSSGTIIIDANNTNGLTRITNNNFSSSGILTEVIKLYGKEYFVDGNQFSLQSDISGAIASIIFVDNSIESSAISTVSNNNVTGARRSKYFLNFHYGNEGTDNDNNIGTVRVKDNNVLLTDGTLIVSSNSKPLLTDDLIVQDNYVKSEISGSKIIKTTAIPSKNYTATENIER